MVPLDEDLPSVHLLDEWDPALRAMEADVAKVVHQVVRGYEVVVFKDQLSVHLFDVHERTVAEFDDPLVAEMEIG